MRPGTTEVSTIRNNALAQASSVENGMAPVSRGSRSALVVKASMLAGIEYMQMGAATVRVGIRFGFVARHDPAMIGSARIQGNMCFFQSPAAAAPRRMVEEVPV